MIPPRPEAPTRATTLWRLLRGFRHDILSAMPERLHRAWMAEFRAPFVHSFLCNDPELVALILRRRPGDFPKSGRLIEGLRPLLGASIFVTNGETWARQRRIVDPAFEGGRLRAQVPAMWAAGAAAASRLAAQAGQVVDVEPETSHAAADVIFRSLFSLPIEHATATAVFEAFRAHQAAQPLVSLTTVLPVLRRFTRPHARATRDSARAIRGMIAGLVDARATMIAAGTAPDDLATRLMTTPDPQTGRRFDREEMIDQVATFFLAGHETGASVLAWALWLLAAAPDWQDRVAAEGAALPATPDLAAAQALPVARAVFREALRLYPPVPALVREAAGPETFRGRPVPKRAQLVISLWHLHRHERLWDAPHAFTPERWLDDSARETARLAYVPFGAGARVCPGAGFAMLEGPLLLAQITAAVRLQTDRPPVPVARLTLRSRDGIRLKLSERPRAASS